jgi:zinc-ribbon domain
MAYLCELGSGQRVYLENQGDQTAVTLMSGSSGQQQQSSSSFQTGSWTAPPEAFTGSQGAVIRVKTARGEHTIQIPVRQVEAQSIPSIMPMEPMKSMEPMKPIEPMKPMEPMKMGDMEMSSRPMEMRMGNMQMRMGQMQADNKQANRTGSDQSESSATPARRFCSQCGVPVDLSDRFCSSCGHRLA